MLSSGKLGYSTLLKGRTIAESPLDPPSVPLPPTQETPAQWNLLTKRVKGVANKERPRELRSYVRDKMQDVLENVISFGKFASM